ncbi:MAG: hypothetical protein ACYDCK_09360, partial [Thermoplasmatota archaeon]
MRVGFKGVLLGYSAVAVIALLLAPSARAADLAPTQNAWVEASSAVTFTSFSAETLDVALHVHKITLSGQLLTAKDMRDAYAAAGSASAKAALVAGWESDLTSTYATTLATEFPDANRTVNPAHITPASLTVASSDAYTPTIDVTESASLVEPRNLLGISSVSDAAITALFDAGASLTRTLTVAASPGYVETLTYTPPPGLAVMSIAPDGHLVSTGARYVISNLAGTSTAVPHTLVVAEPGASPPSVEDVQSTLTLAIPDFPGTAALPVDASISTQIRALDTTTRITSGLPPSVHLGIISADAMRALVNTKALTADQVAKAESALVDSFRDNLSASLGGPVVARGG